MCGIAGLVSPRPGQLRQVRAMCDALRHRGPDDEGYVLLDSARGQAWAFSGPDTAAGVDDPRLTDDLPAGADVALGNRRLAILDPSPAGHGPMGSPDGRLWLTYNGEIFNYVELRTELAALGHPFRSGTDTEVLLAAWAEWGPACLARFNGMWAFAIYDVRERRLSCARDRFGVKPFHYAWDGERLAFASEIAALRCLPGVGRRPRIDALLGFLAAGAVDEGDGTFVDGVTRLGGGGLLTLDLRSRRLEVARWYELPDPEPQPAQPDALRALLEDAVRIRLRSDVPVGTCLSGGLDSSSIVALTARLRAGDKGRLAFSVVYGDEGLDESRFVDAVVEATGVESHRATPQPDELAADLDRLVAHQGEPFPGAGVYSQYRVMKMAREAGVTVLLDGQGADEVLAGYHYHFGPYLAELARTHGVSSALSAAARLSEVTGRSRSFLLALAGFHALPVPEAVRQRARRRFATLGLVPRDALTPEAQRLVPEVDRHGARPRLQDELRANLLRTSLPALLRYEDRNSMAFSVEARTPFLDYRLVELARRWPGADLVRDGWSKAVLRDAMAGVLPEAVRLRRDKLGFASPERRFLLGLAPRLREALGPRSRLAPWLRSDVRERWLAEDDARLVARPGLWRMLSAELWLRHLEAAAC
jgi:asparagine synthase (glutamine-hydrolysing)